MAGVSEDDHVVVFDVNVYLDVAKNIGRPPSWRKFIDSGHSSARGYIPSYDRTRGTDSTVAMYYATQREFVSGQKLSVWTSNHIENLIYRKLTQPADSSLDPNDRGFGWSDDDARLFLATVHDEVVWGSDSDPRGGSTIDVSHPYGPARLGRDDGLVLRTAREAGNDLSIKYCVTKDKPFREIGDPNGIVLVLQPHQWVNLIRESRKAAQPGSLPSPGRHRRPI